MFFCLPPALGTALACGEARKCLLGEQMLSTISCHPLDSASLGALTVREAKGEATRQRLPTETP